MGLEDKTEAATPRRRQEARQEGQVARSMDLNSAFVLIAALLIIKFTGPTLGTKIRAITINYLTHFPKHDLTVGDVSSTLVRLLLEAGLAVAPLILGVAVVGFIGSAMQVGLVISGKPLLPKGERLNPITGMTRLFSMRAGVELVKSIAKILVVGYIVYSFIRSKSSEIASLAGSDYYTACSRFGQLTWALMLRAAIAMFIIAAFDYMYQRWQTEKQLKMTKQEVKEDFKRTEGDPLIKSKIRQRMRQVAQRRMMHEVPKADVVITNPTHYAVAIKYDADVNSAPVVIAKGQMLIAQRIKEIAIENNIPIVENVQLARTLYASVEIGAEIPAELYQAVAEILAYVYRLSHKLKAS